MAASAIAACIGSGGSATTGQRHALSGSGTCGDGVCDPTETHQSCANDCCDLGSDWGSGGSGSDGGSGYGSGSDGSSGYGSGSDGGSGYGSGSDGGSGFRWGLRL